MTTTRKIFETAVKFNSGQIHADLFISMIREALNNGSEHSRHATSSILASAILQHPPRYIAQSGDDAVGLLPGHHYNVMIKHLPFKSQQMECIDSNGTSSIIYYLEHNGKLIVLKNDLSGIDYNFRE